MKIKIPNVSPKTYYPQPLKQTVKTECPGCLGTYKVPNPKPAPKTGGCKSCGR